MPLLTKHHHALGPGNRIAHDCPIDLWEKQTDVTENVMYIRKATSTTQNNTLHQNRLIRSYKYIAPVSCMIHAVDELTHSQVQRCRGLGGHQGGPATGTSLCDWSFVQSQGDCAPFGKGCESMGRTKWMW